MIRVEGDLNMKRVFFAVMSLILVISIVGCNSNLVDDTLPKITSQIEPTTVPNSEVETTVIQDNNNTNNNLSEKQKNSIAMLNYLAMVSQKIESSKNNRIYLEEVYESLLNNINPSIDEKTQKHLQKMLNIIEDYRQISLKREHLRYIYEQDKATHIKNAVPNPLAVLSMVESLSWRKLVATISYTAISAYTNYKSSKEELGKQFMIDGWQLDNEEAKNIHSNRTKTFNYMVDIVREYDLPGYLALNEESVEKFVESTSDTNINRKLQFLKSKKEVYSAFGSYWLEMADCYYELGQYQNCLNCVSQYESIYSDIFRYDYQYAEFLPKAIVAAQSFYGKDKCVEVIAKYTDTLNSPLLEDWALKYFAAQSYIDLYSRTKDVTYLNQAYEIAKNNVNTLVPEQEKLNVAYLKEVVVLKLSDSDTKFMSEEDKKTQQKYLKKLNKSLKEKRKTELLSLYKPLILNCDLLFSLANKLNISNSEKKEIEGILSGVFIIDSIKDKYSFGQKAKYSIDFNEDEIIVPANILIDSSSISVTINSNEGKIIKDFTLSEVERKDKSISSFLAHYESKELKSHKWSEKDTITIKITNGNSFDNITFKYKVKEIKTGVWNSVKGFFGEDKVVFKCIK